MHSFGFQLDGANPTGALIQGHDGSLYGTAQAGPNGCGVVFKMDTAGSFSVVHAFNGADGCNPRAALLLDADGHYYGTTYCGGTTPGGGTGSGTVFKLDAAGNHTVLKVFDGAPAFPGYDPLVRGTDGYLYGTTGTPSDAPEFHAVYRMSSNGIVTVLHSFDGTGLLRPSGLLQASDGNFYGTTGIGTNSAGYGTVYRMDQAGSVTVLHELDPATEGSGPRAGLIRGTDGYFYGTTTSSVFRMDIAGNVTVLHLLTGKDGANLGRLFLGADGRLYGTATYTTPGNPADNLGLIFRVTLGDQPAPTSQTITVTQSAPATAVFGTSFSVAATASSGLAVTIGASGACSISAGTATMTSGTGTCTVTFSQVGNATYAPAPAGSADRDGAEGDPDHHGDPGGAGDRGVQRDVPGGGHRIVGADGGDRGLGRLLDQRRHRDHDERDRDLHRDVRPGGERQLRSRPAGDANDDSAAGEPDQPDHHGDPGGTGDRGVQHDVPVAATASSGLPVTIGASGACSIDAGIVTMTSGTGPCTVTFNQAGNANYSAAPEVLQTTTTEKASQVITVTQVAPATAVINTTFPVAATAAGGVVAIGVSGACSISGGTVTITSGTGTCTVTFDQAGNADYLAAAQVVQSTTAQPVTQGGWLRAADMGTPRSQHTATLLPDGRVLVAGGAHSTLLASTEIYNPTTNSWTAAPSMSTARNLHAATPLSDGRVLVAGGTNGGVGGYLASAEIYDPATNGWSAIPNMNMARGAFTATRLADDRVLVAGGFGSLTGAGNLQSDDE